MTERDEYDDGNHERDDRNRPPDDEPRRRDDRGRERDHGDRDPARRDRGGDDRGQPRDRGGERRGGGDPGRRGDARRGPPPETDLGLDENVASAVAYVLGFLSGIVVFFVEDRNRTVKWHAAQSMVVFGALIVGTWILQAVLWSLVFSAFAFGLWQLISLLTSLLWLGVAAVWVFLVFKAYQGDVVRVPVAAGIADSLVSDGPGVSARGRRGRDDYRYDDEPRRERDDPRR